MERWPERLVLTPALWRQITAHVEACLPEEGCGLLGGTIGASGTGTAVEALAVENMLHSPVRFQMEPAAQLAAMLALEERGLEMLAIFHSHPVGPAGPSLTDRGEFGYPGVLALILVRGNGADGWQGRAYRIDGVYDANASVTEVRLAVEDEA